MPSTDHSGARAVEAAAPSMGKLARASLLYDPADSSIAMGILTESARNELEWAIEALEAGNYNAAFKWALRATSQCSLLRFWPKQGWRKMRTSRPNG